jgi:recombination protein RecA
VAEFDLLYGTGISREGSLIDLGVEQGIVRKSGAWYTYEGDQLGQGKENARNFLRDNPDLANEIEKRIKEKLGIGPRLDVEADAGNAAAGTGNAAAGNGSSANGHPVGNGAAPSRTAAAPSRTAVTVPGVTV